MAVLGSAALAVLGILYVQELAKIDPFAAMRHPATGVDERVGIRLEDVHLRHYRGGDLITQAMVDRVDVSKDRSRFQLLGVHDGVYRGEKAAVTFASRVGEWNDARRVLTVEEGTHIKSKDFDLEVSDFTYERAKSQIHVPGAIKGRLSDGTVEAKNFTYNLNDRSYSAGPVHWTGDLALKVQDGGNGKPTKWHITGDHMSARNGVQIFESGRAESDDAIIQAPHIERIEKTDVVTATGDVHYYSLKANMICDKVVVYNKEKRAVLTGHVRMLVKPKSEQNTITRVEIPPFKPIVPESVAAGRPKAADTEEQKKQDDELRSSESLRKYPIAVYAEKIEYWYERGKRRAEITGNPQARQELTGGAWRHVWTDHALYNGEEETLRLLSAPGKSDTRLKNSKGDSFTMDWVQVSTKEDDDSMDADNITGSIFGDPEDRPDTPKRPVTSTKPPGNKGTATKPGGSPLSGPIGGKGRKS